MYMATQTPLNLQVAATQQAMVDPGFILLEGIPVQNLQN